jgi:DNA-binding HxlR family transcriptional regulator
VALELAANRSEFRMEDFEASCPGVHRRSLQRDLRALIEKQLIVAEGATNRLIYRVVGKP